VSSAARARSVRSTRRCRAVPRRHRTGRWPVGAPRRSRRTSALPVLAVTPGAARPHNPHRSPAWTGRPGSRARTPGLRANGHRRGAPFRNGRSGSASAASRSCTPAGRRPRSCRAGAGRTPSRWPPGRGSSCRRARLGRHGRAGRSAVPARSDNSAVRAEGHRPSRALRRPGPGRRRP
jgi:hypothetical protein